MLLGILKKDSSKVLAAACLLLLLIAISAALELGGVRTSSHQLILRSIITLFIVGIFFLLKKSTRTKLQKAIYIFTFVWAGAFLLNIVLNMVNVYSLGENQAIQSFCAANSQICIFIETAFYKLKLFRFITLSPYFFIFPLLIPLAAKMRTILPKEIKNYHASQKLFLVIIFILVFSNLAHSFYSVYLTVIQGYQVRNENFYDRFTFKQGGASYYGWIRVFSNFIIAHTEPDAGILVPPQSEEYIMEGNTNYFRWFLYPRPLYHLEKLEVGIYSAKIQYVILSGGECESKLCVWPDFEIPTDRIEQILLINRENQNITQFDNTGYTPDEYQNQWGIIKLK